jgi:mono/diheme cytochrome c family protein
MQASAGRTLTLALVLLCAVGAGILTARGASPPRAAAAGAARQKGDPEAAKLKNPVASTQESIAAGKKIYTSYCAGCHGADARGGLVLSVIEDKGGTQPPDLTDEKWDHGSSDGEMFVVTKKGVPPDYFMAPWDGRISDTDIWNVINYLRSLGPKQKQ